MPTRLRAWLPPIFLLLIALWSVWLIVQRSTQVVETYDGVFLVWVLSQTIEKIPGSLSHIFEGNIFYPHTSVMAYSDLLVPSALLARLPVRIMGEPTVATSTTIIFGQIATMLVVYFWLKEMTKNRWAAFLASITLGLSQIRLHYLVHLQMWTMQWWLVSAWMLWRFSKNGKVWQLYVAGAFLVIQVWESLLPVFFIILVGGVLFLQNLAIFKKEWKHLVIVTLLVLLFAFPAARAYWSVSKEFSYVRPIREAAHFSLSLEEIWGKFFSPGLYFLLGLALFLRGLKFKDKNLRMLVAALAVALVLALGPVLKWQGKTLKIFGKFFIPLPYAAAYYLVPGFGALRTPSRFLWVSAWAASGIVALGFKNFKPKLKTLWIPVGLVLIAIGGGTKMEKVYRVPTVSEYPRVYQWLKNQPGKVIIELPLYTWGAGEVASKEVYRMVYSLEHKKALVNGYSGFFPPEWEKLAGDLWENFPNQELEGRLRERGVNYVIVHTDEYAPEKVREIEKWGKGKLIWEDEITQVYPL